MINCSSKSEYYAPTRGLSSATSIRQLLATLFGDFQGSKPLGVCGMNTNGLIEHVLGRLHFQRNREALHDFTRVRAGVVKTNDDVYDRKMEKCQG